MKFIPIAARSARWLSFALAITLALQFVSPLVLAVEPQNAPIFVAMDSRPADRVEDELLEEDELPEDDKFASFKGNLDSMPVLDSFPLRAPRAEVDWREKMSITIIAKDKGDNVIMTLDSTNANTAIPFPVDQINKLEVKGELKFKNGQADTLLTGEANKYEITFSKELLRRTQAYSETFNLTVNNQPIPAFHCSLPVSEPLTFTAYIDDAAKTAFDINIEFSFTMQLKPLEGQNPADPKAWPLVTESSNPLYTVMPYTTTATNPDLEKTVSDNTQIAAPGHPIEWTLQYKTGRMTPDNVAIPYTPREIKIVDTIDITKHTFDHTKSDFLQWTSNDGTKKSISKWSGGTDPTDDDKKDLTKLPFYQITDADKTMTVYLPDTPNNTETDKEWGTVTFKTNVTEDYFNDPESQGKEISNKANLTAGDKKTGDKTAKTNLPKWIKKEGGESYIDTARVTSMTTGGVE